MIATNVGWVEERNPTPQRLVYVGEVPTVTLRVHSRLPVSFAVASLNSCLIWSYTASLVLRPLSPQGRTQAAAHLP